MGVYRVKSLRHKLRPAFIKAARTAVTKACFDTEAAAKMYLTIQGAVDTGAARASLYSSISDGKSNYTQSAQNAKEEAAKGSIKLRKFGKARPKQIKLFPEIVPPDKGKYVVTGIVSVAVAYGYYIEVGTHNMPARPYMMPAEAQVKDSLRQTLHFILNQMVR